MNSAKIFFDKFSEQYEAQNRNKYLFYRWTADNVIKSINRQESVILDLGTGNGEIAIRAASQFSCSSVIGLDVSSGMINEAEKRARKMGLKNLRFVVSRMENLKIESADFVVSHLAFHHVKNKLSMVKKIYEILPRNGRVIIGDWFKPTEAYEKEIEKLRAKDPTLAKNFDESWEDFVSEQSGEYQKEHPKEYPISQIKLKNIIKKAGFRKQKIIKIPIAIFAVVVGEK